MPPKAKKPDANKNQGPVEDETGIPKNEVSFKFSFEVKQTEIADILIMFEWVSTTDSTLRQKFDTELIECWTQKTPEDPTVVHCEIELPYYRIEDKFVKNLCSDKFYIHFVSVEDQTVKDTVFLHYSPLLTAKGEAKFESYHDKIKIPQIEYFQLKLTADKELILPLYRDYLNPLEICIVGAKEMPNPNSGYNKYEPVYVQAKFYDGTVIKTQDVAHGNTCKWMYKQVILAGLMDPIKLKEDLKAIPLTFEVHDQDEIAKNTIKEFKQLIDIKYEEPAPPVEVIDPKAKGKGAAAKKKEPEKKEEKPKDTKPAGKDAKDAKGKKDAKKKKDVKTFEPIKPVDAREFIRVNYGLSNFNLNDLLNPHINALKLRNYIVPLQRFESKDAKNLDLNTTARRELQERHAAGSYMSSESYLVITFELAHGIRPFKKPPQPVQDTLNIQQTDLRPKSKTGGADVKVAAKVDPKKKGVAPVEEPPKVVEIVDEKPIYERAVYIFPYKSADVTPKLLSIVQKINMCAFGQENGNPLFITTKALSEEEKKNRDLDIITGLEFIDNEYRTFILEGLSDKAMKRLEEEFPKEQPNSKDIKIFKNCDIKFKSRLYLDFNIDVKKIKLRENLTKLLTRPDIYLRSKVPENIYHILVTFNEIRRCDNMKAIISSNLFPDVPNIIAMERKYGDALTDEDISGKEGPPQKVVKRTAAKFSTVGSELGLSALGSATTNRGPESGSKRLAEVSQPDSDKLPEINNLGPRSKTARLATRVDKVKHDNYSLHMTQPYPYEGEVFTKAGAKLNIYEKQKAELREIVRNDPNHFYTYSANFLSLSIDPYSVDEVKRLDEEHGKKMWKTKDGFQTILKKDKSEYKVHPKKPHESKIDELNTHPYHQSKLEETKQLTNTRGEPIRNGHDFRLHVPAITFFSSPEIVEEEKITMVERERRQKEAKQKAEEEWKAKMKVDNPYVKTSLCMDRNSQLDKTKGIREGEAVKKGLVMKDNRLKNTTLGMTKTIQENPISIYLAEGWEETTSKNLFERNVDPNRTVSQYDFKRNIKQTYQYDPIYKPMKTDVFNQIQG